MESWDFIGYYHTNLLVYYKLVYFFQLVNEK